MTVFNAEALLPLPKSEVKLLMLKLLRLVPFNWERTATMMLLVLSPPNALPMLLSAFFLPRSPPAAFKSPPTWLPEFLELMRLMTLSIFALEEDKAEIELEFCCTNFKMSCAVIVICFCGISSS